MLNYDPYIKAYSNLTNMIKENKLKKQKRVDIDFIEEHLSFILTIGVTYIVGIIIIVMEYIALAGEDNFMKVFLDSLIPTTITYMLGCILVNISDLVKSSDGRCVWNVLGCVFIFIYVLIFSMYLSTDFSWIWVAIELILTTEALLINIMCYKEKYIARNHSLT